MCRVLCQTDPFTATQSNDVKLMWLGKSFFCDCFTRSRRSENRTEVTVTQRQSLRPSCFYTSSRLTLCLAPANHPHRLNLPPDSCGNHSMCPMMAFPLLMQVIWPFLLVGSYLSLKAIWLIKDPWIQIAISVCSFGNIWMLLVLADNISKWNFSR